MMPWQRTIGLLLSTLMIMSMPPIPQSIAEGIAEAKARKEYEQRMRDIRTSIDDELPIGRQHEVGLALMLQTAKRMRATLRSETGDKTFSLYTARLQDELSSRDNEITAGWAAIQQSLAASRAGDGLLELHAEFGKLLKSRHNALNKILTQGQLHDVSRAKLLEAARELSEALVKNKDARRLLDELASLQLLIKDNSKKAKKAGKKSVPLTPPAMFVNPPLRPKPILKRDQAGDTSILALLADPTATLEMVLAQKSEKPLSPSLANTTIGVPLPPAAPKLISEGGPVAPKLVSEGGKEAKANALARSVRLKPLVLPLLGDKHLVISQAKTHRRILNKLMELDVESLLKDLAVLERKIQGVKIKSLAQWQKMRAKLLQANASETLTKRNEAFRVELVKKFHELARVSGVVQRSRGNTEKLSRAIDDLIHLLEPPVPAGNQQASTRRLNRRNAQFAHEFTEMPPYFGDFMFAAAADVISDLLLPITAPSVTGPPTAADLAATIDIELDAEIEALADSLDNNATKIFEFVRNEFAYEPYFGSVKGAKKTISEKAGNDMDLASALMALYRAADIPCRYVFGTIEMSVDEAAKWVGADEPNQVAKIFTANGIPNELDVSGGGVGTIRVDHVFVKAFVDYFPYRGAVNEVADTWVGIDPSFKQNTFTDSRDVEVQTGISPDVLLANIRFNTETIDPDGNFASGLPEDFIITELFAFQQPIRNYLAANGLTTENVFRQRIVAEERIGILPTTDQYKVVARGLNFSELPDALRQQLTIVVKNTDGTEAFKVTRSLPSLADKKITLSYRPETPDDAQVIADNSDSVDIPVFLVRLVPVLKVDGVEVAAGPAIGMGRKQALNLTFTAVDGSTELVQDTVTAGSYNALVLDYQQMVAANLDRQRDKLEATATALQAPMPNPDPEDTVGDTLHAIGLSYFHQIDRFNQITAGSLEVATTRVPSVVRVSWDLSVDEAFGLPFAARADRVRIDVGRDVHIPIAIKKEDLAAEQQFTFTSALTSSALEHNALIQPLANEAASTVRVIEAANKESTRIFTVTASNAASIVPLLELNLPTSAINDILDAVNANQEVTVPESPVTVEGVTYVAYIKRDIDTSASEFVLDDIAGGDQVNTSLRAADLLQSGNAARYLSVLQPTARWLKVTQGSTTNAGLSYLPAVTSINNWYKDRTELDPVTTIAAAIAVSGPITRLSRDPAILNVVAGPDLISPNGDGINETFTIQADVTRDATWTVEIKDSEEIVIFTETASTPTIDVVFDQPVQDGTFTFEITAVSGATEAIPVSGSFQADTLPPLASVFQPLPGETIQGAIEIRGTADDENFTAYTIAVEDQFGSFPVVESIQPVLGQTLTVLDTTLFDNGPVTIVLEVNDRAGNTAEERIAVIIGNPVPDTTLPTVDLVATNPADLQPITSETGPVSGIIQVAVTASDNDAVDTIQVFLDGVLFAENSGQAALNTQIDTTFLGACQHTLKATATDPSGNVRQTDVLTFLTAGDISAFALSPRIATQENSTITISAALQQAANWTLTFTGPAPIPQISGGRTTVTGTVDATQFADGDYTVTLAVAGITQQPVLPFAIDLVALPPIAEFFNVFDNTVIREGLFTLQGIADDPDPSDPVSYRVELLTIEDAVVKNLTPGVLNTGGFRETRVTDRNLGVLDFTLTRNGTYSLRLTVKGGGQTRSVRERIILDSQLKVGQFGFSQQDLIIPVNGLPISVIRTYNSLNPNEGEFGFGWTYAISDVEMELDESRIDVTNIDGDPSTLRTGGGRNVTITLPDGRRTTFAFSLLSIDRFGFQQKAIWTPTPGVLGYSLEPTVSPILITLFNDLVYWAAGGLDASFDNYDFPAFILTTPSGDKYRLEREDGGVVEFTNQFGGTSLINTFDGGTLVRIDQRTGDRIEFSPSQIEHFNAAGEATRKVVFERDGQDRIIAIHDPNNLDAGGNPVGPPVMKYDYDVAGNLISAGKLVDKTDPQNPIYNTTEYVYGDTRFLHFITKIKDPRGVTPMKSFYDDDGRLIATEDAFGNRIDLDHDLDGQTETIFDRLGNPTVHLYDERGNVTVTIDAHGNRTTRTYDTDNNEIAITDALGNTTTSTFDGNGNRTSVTDPRGNTSTFTYDNFNNPLTSTDPLGNTTTNAFDGNGNLTSTTNALGQTTTNQYDGNSNLTATVDALGNVTATFGYDASGNLTSTNDFFDFERTFVYDDNGRQTSTSFLWINPDDLEDRRVVSTSTEYDESGQVVRAVDADGKPTFTFYNPIGKPEKNVDKFENSMFNTYNARGELIETEFPPALTGAEGSGAEGDVTVTRTVYDLNGRSVVTTDRHVPGEVTNGSRTIYNAIGQVVRSERLANVVIEIVTEQIGGRASSRAVFVSFDSIISTTSSEFDATGRVLESTNADGETTKFEYDNAGRQAAVVDALGNRTETEYDKAGRQVLVRDTLGRETTSDIDALGRRVKTNLPPAATGEEPTSVITQFNELGQRVAQTDQNGNTRTFQSDVLGKLTAVVLPAVIDPATTAAINPRYEYEYDTFGRLRLIKDPIEVRDGLNERVTKFTYDEQGRQITRTLPLEQSEVQAYNDLGQLEWKRDFKGQVMEMVYDGLGRLEKKRSYATATAGVPAFTDPLDATGDFDVDFPDHGAADKTVVMVYDDLGRIFQIQDSEHGVTENGYDVDSRLVRVSSPEGTVNYEYDEVTNRLERTFTANNDTRHAYDELGRLKTVTIVKRHGATLATPEEYVYTYTDVGTRESLTYPNGVVTEWEFDDLNRLTEMTNTKVDGVDETLLSSYAYALAPNGRRTGVTEIRLEADDTSSRTDITWGYDALNRLVSEASGSTISERSFSTIYEYGITGSRLLKATNDGVDVTAVVYVVDDNDRLLDETESLNALEVASTVYGYSDNGEQTSKVRTGTDAETSVFGYNLDGRLGTASIQRTEDGTPIDIQSSYVYNQRGIRARASSSVTNLDTTAVTDRDRLFVIDANNMTGSHQVLEEIASVGGAPVVSYALGGDVLEQTNGAGVRHFLTDGQRSNRLLTDNAGDISDRFDFTAYGERLGFDSGALSPAATNLLYSGEQFDNDLQLGYHRARYLSHSTGTWNRLDPFGGNNFDPQSLHKYAYVHGNPLTMIDPSGLFGLIGLLKVVAIIAVILIIYIAFFAGKGDVTACVTLRNRIIRRAKRLNKWKNKSQRYIENLPHDDTARKRDRLF